MLKTMVLVLMMAGCSAQVLPVGDVDVATTAVDMAADMAADLTTAALAPDMARQPCDTDAECYAKRTGAFCLRPACGDVGVCVLINGCGFSEQPCCGNGCAEGFFCSTFGLCHKCN